VIFSPQRLKIFCLFALLSACHSNTKSPIELYNLSSDTGEENNIADKNPEIVKMIEDIMLKARFEDTLWSLIPSQIK